MAKTNLGLIEYAKAKMALPNIYFLSGIGRKLTEAMIQKRITNGCSFTIANQAKIRTGIGKYAFDCGGLIKAYLWETSPGVIDYNRPIGSDQNARMMYNAATAKGPLNTMPDLKGLLVFTADLGHVGIYIGRDGAGNRQYIECSPAFGKWGIFYSNDTMRKWTYWGKYALIQYIEEVKTVYVDRIVEVDRPIDVTLTDGSLSAHIVRK